SSCSCVVLLVEPECGVEPPSGAWEEGQERAQRKEPDVACNVPGVGSRGVRRCATTAEAPALDLEPTGPGGRDADDERELHQCRQRGHDARSKAEHEQDTDDQLECRESMPDKRNDRLRQQLVGADGADAGRRIWQLEPAGDDPDTTDDDARNEPAPV